MRTRVFEGDRRSDAVAPDDRGLAYGDGLFETMRVHRGAVPWWKSHWSRLDAGARRLRLPLPGQALVREQAAELFDDHGDGVLKVLVTRGRGGRGYSPPRDAMPTWVLSRHPLPSRAPGLLRLHWCETRLATPSVLAGVKHCNRLEQVLARAECDDVGADEGLVRDSTGDVVGAIAANVFVLHGRSWTTPPVDRCGIAGVCRAHLLSLLHASVTRLEVGDIEHADAIFLCNAVRGILAVGQIDARTWSPHPAVDDARRALARIHPGFATDTEIT